MGMGAGGVSNYAGSDVEVRMLLLSERNEHEAENVEHLRRGKMESPHARHSFKLQSKALTWGGHVGYLSLFIII